LIVLKAVFLTGIERNANLIRLDRRILNVGGKKCSINLTRLRGAFGLIALKMKSKISEILLIHALQHQSL
jgi:hypothetical protein